MTIEQSILRLVFPEEIFEWFDLISGTKDKDVIRLVFEEKNIPPIANQNKKLISKGFKDITITDFPIRGRRTFLTFRRRSWQIEGEHRLIKRNIKLSFPGTQIEQEFAAFLKAESGE